MNTKSLDTKLDTKQHILQVGYQLITQKGFTAMGLSELLKAAEVPKGSFYHYFTSKEQFGEALLQDYFDHYFTRVDALFNAGEGNDYQKMMRYWQYWLELNSIHCESGQCLVVKLAAEVTDLSEAMRHVMLSRTNQVITRIADGIERGRINQSIQVSDSRATAERLYSLWIGACLLNKIRQDDSSLQQALTTTEQILTGNPLS
ncbi:TetR/AcrR family transcriptional regulator [Vibrio sp. PP-XX7]